MGFAFSHLIGAWASGKIYEFFSKKKISHAAWFFLLLGGILPDIDFLLDWILGYDSHRTFTHSIFFLIIVPIMVYLFFSIIKNPEKKQFAFFIGLGIAAHLFLDSFSAYGIPLLWPVKGYFSFFSGFTAVVPKGGLLEGNAEMLLYKIKLAIIDMALGTGWIFYLWFRKKLQF